MHQRFPPSTRLAAIAAALAAALLTAGCAGVGVGVTIGPGGPAAVDLAFFHDQLDPYGDWLWVPPWGWVWQPWGVEPGWVPYSHGRWAYTELGWYWVSSWDWGWAPFHYGRWHCDHLRGWVWVPGTVWAPAWVTWRHGPDWVGWAPLPPEAGWDPHAGLRYQGAEPDPTAWSFVRPHELVDTRIEARIQPRARNVSLVEGTRAAVAFEPSGGYAVERGLPPEVVERATGRPVERYRVEDLGRPPLKAREAVSGDTLRIYRPPVEATRPLVSPPSSGGAAPQAVGPSPSDVKRVESWGREQEKRLEKIQVQERKQPPAGVSAEELQRRQASERKALREDVEKRQRWLPPERPRPQLKPAPPPPKQPPAKPAAKPEGGKPPAGEGR